MKLQPGSIVYLKRGDHKRQLAVVTELGTNNLSGWMRARRYIEQRKLWDNPLLEKFSDIVEHADESSYPVRRALQFADDALAQFLLETPQNKPKGKA